MAYMSAKVFALSAGVFLAGCAALPGGGPAPLDTFDLTSVSVSSQAQRKARTQILIAEPNALKVLDSENIVIRPSAGSVEFLSGAQWADRLPRIVQARLAEALQSTGRFGGVGRPGDGLAIDYQIITDIRAFEVRLDGARRAEVRLSVKILNDRNGTVRAERTFSASVPAAQSGGNAAYTSALNAAFGQTTEEIVRWVLAST